MKAGVKILINAFPAKFQGLFMAGNEMAAGGPGIAVAVIVEMLHLSARTFSPFYHFIPAAGFLPGKAREVWILNRAPAMRSPGRISQGR